VTQTARAVVVGGGIAGCSVLYHLARLGWKDLVLVEKGDLASGSTWHAAGLCTQYNGAINVMRLLRKSIEFYPQLEKETGQNVGFHQTGSLRLATSEVRMDEFRAVSGKAAALGVPFEIVSPQRVQELCPLIAADGILGAAYLPTDGHVDPAGLTQALAMGARARGAQILLRTCVTMIQQRSKGWRVVTDQGVIDAPVVINAAGMWAPEVGAMAGAALPIVPMEHQYVVTGEIPQLRSLPRELPVIRDVDASYYVRAEAGGLIVGPFEAGGKHWAVDGVPSGFESKLLEPDLQRIEEILTQAAARFPALADVGIRRVVNGPDGYTPDGRCLAGELLGFPNFFVLAGFSIFGIVFGSQAGRYIAEWIAEGQPSNNIWEMDVTRFGDYAAQKTYLLPKTLETMAREYAPDFPDEERPAGRPCRVDPLYDRLRERGAVFGARSGWERPVHFSHTAARYEHATSFREPEWFNEVASECLAVRSKVGILDQSSFAKYEVSGPGAFAFLDGLSANRVPAGIGGIAISPMLTQRGGIQCDLTIAQIAEGVYYVVGAAATETHDLAWLLKHVPDDRSVVVRNVTADYGVLTVAGPRSRAVLQQLSASDLSTDAFPYLTAQWIQIAGRAVRAMRVSYTGELGWELHIPADSLVQAYEAIIEVGEEFGIVDFGYRALDSLRLEKGYRLWGPDTTPDYTPLEAGLAMFVRFSKDFIGRSALLRQAESGISQSLTCIDVTCPKGWLHGGEAVLDTTGGVVGYTTSAGYGHSVSKNLGLVYLPLELSAEGTRLQVQVIGERYDATTVRTPAFDPDNRRYRE